jgi:uncharacterized MAPEG superfamily protein
MTTPFLCVFFAWLLIFAPKIPLSVAMAKAPGGYDNKHPRDQQDRLTGWAARAKAAHLNGFESFPPFAAGVVIAHLAGLDPYRASLLAITFVVARALYPVLYILDLDYLRSGVWGVGLLATAGLYLLPWLAPAT